MSDYSETSPHRFAYGHGHLRKPARCCNARLVPGMRRTTSLATPRRLGQFGRWPARCRDLFEGLYFIVAIELIAGLGSKLVIEMRPASWLGRAQPKLSEKHTYCHPQLSPFVPRSMKLDRRQSTTSPVAPISPRLCGASMEVYEAICRRLTDPDFTPQPVADILMRRITGSAA